MAQDCGEYREPAGAAPQKLKRRFPPPWSGEESVIALQLILQHERVPCLPR
jgi:hypothetical protein